jgi:hypothetical protein
MLTGIRGREGTSGPFRIVPAEWLHEFEYRGSDKKAWVKQPVVPPGTVKNPRRFYGINMVDAATAFRWDCLLNGWL